MTQLQLYTTKTQRGYKSLVNINPSEDVMRYVHDNAPALEILRYDPSELQYFILLRYIDMGLLLTVLRPLPGGRHDHYAATLYFANGIEIPVGEVVDIIDAVKGFVSAGDPSAADVAEMRNLLSKEYPVDSSRPRRHVSSGHHYAFALYGGHNAPSFEDFVAANFYQPEYSDYAGVVLLDSHGLARGMADAADVGKPELARLVCVKPPRKSPQGFMPHIGRRPFDAPVYAREGAVMTINWHKGGFETVIEKVKVEGDNFVPPIPDTSSARRVITPATFYITEERGQKHPVGNYLIKVNGIEIDGPKAFTFSDLEDARVEISAPGYLAFTGHYDLASTSQVLIQMRALHKTYRFDLPLVTPEPSEAVRIYIKSKKPLDQCPIEGYAVAGGSIVEGSGISNRLEYTGVEVRRRYVLPAAAGVAGLLLGLLVGWLCFGSSASSPVHADEEAVVVEPVVSDTVATVPEIVPQVARAETVAPGAAAIEYLDNNKVWKRADMEAVAGLQGLFDDLNSYNFDKLSQDWAVKLETSKNFAAVVRAVGGAMAKRDPRTGAHNPLYDNDASAINWRTYTYWIDP